MTWWKRGLGIVLMAVALVGTMWATIVTHDAEVAYANTEVKQLKEMSEGDKILFAERTWIVLDPEEGYILIEEPLGMKGFDSENKSEFKPNDPNNIGHYLNTTYYEGLTTAEQAAIQETEWDIGQYDVVEANIGLLSEEEWETYKSTIGNPTSIFEMWLRTPRGHAVLRVKPDGGTILRTPDSHATVRPALTLDSEIFVSVLKESALKDASKGAEFTFAGQTWIILNPVEGYVISKDSLKRGPFSSDSEKKFNPENPNNIGYYLNTTFYGNLEESDQAKIQAMKWTIGDETNENRETVDAEIGLLSYSEWPEYQKIIGNPLHDMWLRTPCSDSDRMWILSYEGYSSLTPDYNRGQGVNVRPTMFLDSNMVITVENEVILPEVSFAPNGDDTWVKEHKLNVSISDPNKVVNTSQYQWSISPYMPPGGDWLNFTNGDTITSPVGIAGESYLHVRGLDSDENVVLDDVSEAFKLVKPLKEMKQGEEIIFADRDWIVLKPEEGYIFSKKSIGDMQFDPSKNNKFDPMSIYNIANFLNVAYYDRFTAAQQMAILKREWNIGNENNEEAEKVEANIGLLSYKEWTNYGTIGFLSIPSESMWLRTPTSDDNDSVYGVSRKAWSGWPIPRKYTVDEYLAVHPTLTLNPDIPLTDTNNVILTDVAFDSDGHYTWTKGHTTTVTVKNEFADVSDIEYAWSTEAKKPTNGWSAFIGDPIQTPSNMTGVYYLHIKGTDSLMGDFYHLSKPFRLDNTAPTAPEITVPMDWTNNKEFTITSGTDDDSGVEKTEYRIEKTNDWGVWQDLGEDGNITIEDEGEITIQAKTVDKVGNVSEITSVTVKIDRTDPNVEFDPNGNNQVAKVLSTKVTASDEASDLDTWEYIWSESDVTPDDQENWSTFTNEEEIKKTGGDGKWYLHIKAKDKAGNIANVHSDVFHLDNTLPKLKINMTHGDSDAEYTDDTWTNEKVKVSIEATDENMEDLQIKVNDNLVENVTGDVYEHKFQENGIYKVSITATDKAGNETSERRTIKIDQSKPSRSSIQLDPKGWTNADKVTVTITDGEDEDNGSGVARTEYRIGEDDHWITYENPFDITGEGETTIYARTIDKAKNKSDISEAVVQIKRTNPNGPTIHVPTSDWTNADAVTVTLTGDKDSRSIEYQLNGTDGKWQTYVDSFDVNDEGITTIHARVVGKAGNLSEVAEATVKIDRTEPELTLKGDNPLTLEVGTAYEEPGATAEDDVDGDISEQIEISGEVDTMKSGNYKIRYNVSDSAGNKAIEVIRTVEMVDTTAPTEVTLTEKDATTNSITFEMSAYDLSGIKEYVLSRDGEKVAMINGEQEEYTDTELQSGETYTYTVVAVDNHGNESEEVSLDVTTKLIISDENHIVPEKEEKHVEKGGDPIPKTATNYFNWLLVGFLLIILAAVIWQVNRKRKRIE